MHVLAYHLQVNYYGRYTLSPSSDLLMWGTTIELEGEFEEMKKIFERITGE